MYFNLNATMPWPGRLMVTRVMRIEKKYRTPPTGICVEISPEEIYEGIYENLRKLEIGLPVVPKPELNLEVIPPKGILVPPTPPR